MRYEVQLLLYTIIQGRRVIRKLAIPSPFPRRRRSPRFGLPRLPGRTGLRALPGVVLFLHRTRPLRFFRISLTHCWRLPRNAFLGLRAARIQRRHRLTLLASPRRRIEIPRLSLPPGVGLGGQHFYLFLAHDVLRLLGKRGRVTPLVPQPLVPVRRDLDLAVVRRPRVVHDAAPAGVWVRVWVAAR